MDRFYGGEWFFLSFFIIALDQSLSTKDHCKHAMMLLPASTMIHETSMIFFWALSITPNGYMNLLTRHSGKFNDPWNMHEYAMENQQLAIFFTFCYSIFRMGAEKSCTHWKDLMSKGTNISP